MYEQLQTSPDVVMTITRDNFREMVLEGQGPIAVEFMSYGCSHCRAIEPVLQEAANAIKATEKVFRVNIAQDEDLASEFAIASTPTFVMFLDGREVGRVDGPKPLLLNVTSALTRSFV